MQALGRIICKLSADLSTTAPLRCIPAQASNVKALSSFRSFSRQSGGGGNEQESDWGKEFGGTGLSSSSFLGDSSWEGASLWSTGITQGQFDGEVVGHHISTPPDAGHASKLTPTPTPNNVGTHQQTSRFGSPRWTDEEMDKLKGLEEENRKGKAFVDGWDQRVREMSLLLKQVREPGSRGSYLKDSEKAEMYRLHKENPEVYTVERLAKDYRIMRQRVLATLWLKEDEEKEKILGHPLDDSVEKLLDSFPEFFNFHDREFHVASLKYKPEFKVMPEGWDGTTRDPDEVHYEISMKEDEMLYQEFVQRFKFNQMKIAKEVLCHKYSRRRPTDGWNFMVEKLGPRGKRGDGGGWKFISVADGSSRPLNERETMFVQRETRKRRRRVVAPLR